MKDLQVSFVYVMYAESPPPFLKKRTSKQKKKKPLKNSKNIQNQKYYIVRYILIYCKQSSYLYLTRFSNITYELADCHNRYLKRK